VVLDAMRDEDDLANEIRRRVAALLATNGRAD
jgi:hypothetical protein